MCDEYTPTKKARVPNNVSLNGERLRRYHDLLIGQTQLPLREDVVRFIVEQLHLSCGAREDCLRASERDNILLLLTIVQLVLKPETHSTTRRRQNIYGYLGKLLGSCDMFISYSAGKSLMAVLQQSQPEDLTDGFFQRLVLYVLSEQINTNGIIHTLDLFRNILGSKRSGTKENVDRLTDCQDLCFRDISRLWTKIVQRFLATSQGGDNRDSHRHHGDDIMYSFLSLWAKLLKFARAKTCQDTADEKCSIDFVECAVELAKHVSLQSFLVGCFSKAVYVLNHSLPTASQLAMTHTTQIGSSGTLVQFIIDNTESLLASVPKRDGILFFGGTYCERAGHVGGSGTDVLQNDHSGQQAVDDRGMRGVALVIIKSCAIAISHVEESQTDDQLARVTKTLMQLKRHIDENASLTSNDHWLTGLFADQDDQLLEALLCLLCVVGGCRKRHGLDLACTDCGRALDPHTLFLHFLGHACWDHSVLLDFLSSPETCFLVLLVKQLHCMAHDWVAFCHACRRYSETVENGVDDRDLSEALEETHRNLHEEFLEDNRNMPCETCSRVHQETHQGRKVVQDGDIGKAVINTDSDRTHLRMLVSYSDSEDSCNGNCDRTCDDCHSDRHEEEIVEGVYNDRYTCGRGPLAFLDINESDASQIASKLHSSSCKSGHVKRTLYSTLYSGPASSVVMMDDDSSKAVAGKSRVSHLCDTSDTQNTSSKVRVTQICNFQKGRHLDCTRTMDTVSQPRDTFIPGDMISQLITESDSEIECQTCSAESSTASEGSFVHGSSTANTPATESAGLIQHTNQETNKGSTINSENEMEVNDSEPDLELQNRSSENDTDSETDSSHAVTVMGTRPPSECLDQTMTMLIRLRMKMERLEEQALFPYNARPLLRLLHMCEQLYES